MYPQHRLVTFDLEAVDDSDILYDIERECKYYLDKLKEVNDLSVFSDNGDILNCIKMTLHMVSYQGWKDS